MSAFASLKAAVDPFVGNRVYRDNVPDLPAGITFPCSSILEDVARARALTGDGRTMAMREVWQVDLWQTEDTEDDSLLPAVIDAIDGLALAAPKLRVQVDGVQRLVDEEKIVHHAITVRTTSLL